MGIADGQYVSMKGVENPISHWSRHSVLWRGMRFPNSESAIQAIPFKNRFPEVVRKIRDASTPKKAMEIARVNATRLPKGRHIEEGTVMEITWLKIEQHHEVRSALLATRDLPIVLDTNDDYWGAGRRGRGRNKAGKIMERCRDELLRNRYALSQEEVIFSYE